MGMKVDTEWWKEIFDDVYLMTDSRSVCDDALTRAEVDFIEAALGSGKALPILDLCGGQGRHAVELSRRGFKNITVLDYSSYLIRLGEKLAEQQGLETIFLQGDARDTGLTGKSFGAVIIMGGSFGYFVQDQENEKILKETFRLLENKGRLLLDLPNKAYVLDTFSPLSVHHPNDTTEVTRTRTLNENILYCTERIVCKKKGCLRENNYCVVLYSPDKITQMLRRIGFSNISFKEDFMPRHDKGDFGTMTNRMVVKAQKMV